MTQRYGFVEKVCIQKASFIQCFCFKLKKQIAIETKQHGY